MIQVQVLFFAQLRDAFGKDTAKVDIRDGTTVSTLVESLFKESHLETWRALPVLYAVNEDFVKGDLVLHDQDVLALIPPVAGG